MTFVGGSAEHARSIFRSWRGVTAHYRALGQMGMRCWGWYVRITKGTIACMTGYPGVPLGTSAQNVMRASLFADAEQSYRPYLGALSTLCSTNLNRS